MSGQEKKASPGEPKAERGEKTADRLAGGSLPATHGASAKRLSAGEQETLNRSLRAALDNDSVELALHWIVQGADGRLRNGAGTNALELAVFMGDGERARALWAFSDPQEKNTHQNTPLMIAAARGETECLEFLIPVSNLEERNENGQTAFEAALFDGVEESVEKLMPHYDLANVNSLGDSALSVAAGQRHANLVRLLLPLSDPLKTNKTGWTALLSAAYGGCAECVEMLWPLSDPSVRSQDGGLTPLMLAIEREGDWADALDAVKFLIARSDLDAVDDRGRDAALRARNVDFSERESIEALIGLEKAKREREALLAEMDGAAAKKQAEKLPNVENALSQDKAKRRL